MATGPIYQVNTYLDDGWWMVQVPELGLLSNTKQRDEVEQTARKLIAVSLDVDDHSFGLRIDETDAPGR